MNLQRETDAELLSRVSDGRQADDAFAAFYRRYETTVLSYLRRRVPNAELATDLMAETFAAALVGAGRFDPKHSRDSRAAGWLLTIAHHKLINSIERGRVADETRLRLQAFVPLALDDEALERVDELASVPEDLGALLAGLPEEQRTALIARVIEGRPYDQIASDLQCSELVVRKRVSRGLARLRRRLNTEAA